MSDNNGTDKPASNGALAELQQAMYAVANEGKKGEWLSFDPTTEKGAEMLVMATLGSPDKLSTMAGKKINVTNFYAHDAGKVQQDGEMDEWTRIVLFDDAGKAYSCGSRGVAKSLAILMRIAGNLPWNPGVPCEIKVDTLPGPKLWITLLPDLASLISQKKKQATKSAR